MLLVNQPPLSTLLLSPPVNTASFVSSCLHISNKEQNGRLASQFSALNPSKLNIYLSLGDQTELRFDPNMASMMSNPVVTNTDRSSRRKRKKKSLSVTLQSQNRTDHQNQNQLINNSKWRTATEEKHYSSKLIQALRHVRANNSSAPASSSSIPRRGRAIREAADRVLAVTAKGRTRWSRAILTNRLKLKFLKAKKPKVPSPTRTSRSPKLSLVLRRKAKILPAVQKKARVLGNLVPGCKKQTLPVILEEAHDYISALEMQVRAMTALAELLSVAGALSSHSNPPPPRPSAT